MSEERDEGIENESDDEVQKQVYGRVTIKYDMDPVLLPESDYVKLLHDMSKCDPPRKLVLFRSRVGIAGVAVLAGLLGAVFGFHLLLLVQQWQSFPSPLVNWSLYAVIMCVYHWSEFLITCVHHPQSANFDSFLVNQSLEFGIAIVASWIEFLIEVWLVPSLKTDFGAINLIGVGMIVIGQALRSLAMWQAGPSFTHMIASKKEKRHKLITDGVYSVLRHPGYFGWFYWSIGTQFLLGNPLCAVAYFLAAQRFFKVRIPIEEHNLELIFGNEYREYKQRTWIGIPGVKA